MVLASPGLTTVAETCPEAHFTHSSKEDQTSDVRVLMYIANCALRLTCSSSCSLQWTLIAGVAVLITSGVVQLFLFSIIHLAAFVILVDVRPLANK